MINKILIQSTIILLFNKIYTYQSLIKHELDNYFAEKTY